MYTFYLPSGLRVSTHELTSVRESRIVARDPLMVDGDIVGKKKKKREGPNLKMKSFRAHVENEKKMEVR